MDFGRITDPQAWKQAMANLLRRGEEVGTYIEQAPTKAGQAIIDAGQRQSALMNEAFDPTGKTLIRNPQAANQAAMNLLEGPLSIAPVGMMIGPESKLWNLENAFEASKLEKQNLTPETIWQKTGTGRGLDTAFRQEISDAPATFKGQGNSFKEIYKDATKPKGVWYTEPTVNNVLNHPQLFEAYPELKGYKIELSPSDSSYNGLFNEVNKTIKINENLSKEQALSTMLHELQHGVQGIESWARGGNLEEFPSAQVIKDAQIIQNLVNNNGLKFTEASKKFEELFGRRPNFQSMGLASDKKAYVLSPNPVENYMNLAGESEARLTQNRQNLSQEERKLHFPMKFGKEKYGLDVEPNEALISKPYSNYRTRKELLEQLLNKQK